MAEQLYRRVPRDWRGNESKWDYEPVIPGSPLCGAITDLIHEEMNFILFCTKNRDHPGGHVAMVHWEDDSISTLDPAPKETES